MGQVGFGISSEEHRPDALVQQAVMAEQAGFTFALISDHFHPWVDAQGQSPFVWSVLGAIAQSTERLQIGTGVTCPTVRIHPAIVAQAAATIGAMSGNRFFLGVGTGENLNEHILGDRWPEVAIRREMLEEAIEVIRLLWQGGPQSHHGKHYTVENAQIYTLPDQPVPIHVAASGPQAAEMAGRIGDGLISTDADSELVQTFYGAGGEGKPRFIQLTCCLAEDEATGRKTALEIWPNAGLSGELSQELPTPAHFQQASQNVTEEIIGQAVNCSTDPAQHIAQIQEAFDAGFDHVYVHQVGHEQQRMIDFYRDRVLPHFANR